MSALVRSVALDPSVAIEKIYDQFHDRQYLSLDPLEFVHRYDDPLDQEAVALVAALLAYGNVKQIRASVEKILDAITQSPHFSRPSEFVRSLQSPSSRRTPGCVSTLNTLRGLYHRFNVGDDFVTLFSLLAMSWKKHGSLGAHFTSKLTPGDDNISNALTELIQEWKATSGLEKGSSFYYLLTSPSDGSTCKRWCMFLRWMGRKDELDPGLWIPFGLKSSQLVFPLDTHTGRIAREWRLTQRQTLNWKAALEVTEALKAFDPIDPVRFDFSLCRSGMLAEKRAPEVS